jgi:hypothetical protein
VLVDIAIELLPGGDAAGIAERLAAGPGRLVAGAAKVGRIEFAPLLAAINLVVAADKRALLRVTVVHEADGRVVELSEQLPEDALGERELPRLRNTPVTVRKRRPCPTPPSVAPACSTCCRASMRRSRAAARSARCWT